MTCTLKTSLSALLLLSHPPYSPIHHSHRPTMLLWTILLCLLSATFAVTDFGKRELLETRSPTTLIPLTDGSESNHPSDDLNRIRGLLKARQGACPYGYGHCESWPSSSVLFFQPSLSFHNSSVLSYARFFCGQLCYTMLIHYGNDFPQVLPNRRGVLLSYL